MSIQKQKEIADFIYSKLEIIDPYCLLAGGAPRDWYFGEEANDLDFYYFSSAVTMGAAKKQLERAFPNQEITFLMNKRSPHEDSLYATMPNLVRIMEMTVEGMPVQFIQLTSSRDQFKVVKNMDVSICKAWYKNGQIGFDRDFELTIASSITFLKDGYCWSDKHGQKMLERFKGRFAAGTKEQAINRIVNETLKGIKDK